MVSTSTDSTVSPDQARWAEALQHAQAAAARAGQPAPEVHRLLAQSRRAGSLSKRVIWLRRAAWTWSANLSGISACRPGCHHCCHLPVTISDIEAWLIGEHLETHPLAVPGALSTRELLTRFEAGHAQPELPGSPVLTHEPYARPCPFLGGHGNCTIHQVRPIMCALHHSLAPDASLCELQPGHSQPVPYADATVLKASMLLAQPGARWADIRAFFTRSPESPPRDVHTPAPPQP